MAISKLVAGAKGAIGNSTGAEIAETVNGLIDVKPTNKQTKFKDKLFIFCGDSTTEQANSNQGMFDRLTGFYATNGMIFEGAEGFVNYGGSGQTLSDFLTRNTEGFTGASRDDPTWNYSGSKPTGAVGLKDAIKTDGDIYVVCYGINDLILYPETGNLPEDDIVAYLTPMLVEAVRRISLAKPSAMVLLRTPNAMTARPVNPSFPSSTGYPDFGDNLEDDQNLVLKWNNALERSYIEAEKILGYSVTLIDTKRYSIYDRGVDVSADDRVEMTDLVHPSQFGYSAMADGLVSVLSGFKEPVRGVVALADRQQKSDGTNAYSIYPEYVDDKPDGINQIFTTSIVSSGSTYIDLDIPYELFTSNVADRPIYIRFNNIGTLKFDNYNPLSLGGSQVRVVGITVPDEFFNAAPCEGLIYQDSGIKPKFVAVAPLSQLRALYVFDYNSGAKTSVKIHTGIAVPQAVNFDIYNIRSNTRTLLGSGIVGVNGFTGTASITETTFVDGDTLEVSISSPSSYTGDAIIRVEI